MTSTTILGENGAAIVQNESRTFNWGAVIAGAIAAAAVTFFFATLGSGIGLTFAARGASQSAATFLTIGAIYFFASQAFGFTVGGYLVGRLIGPEIESTKEEEFRAAAHGFVMWALVVVAGLLITGFAALFSDTSTASDARTTSVAADAALHLWTAFALLFGAVVAIAAAISARWMDDKVTFSLSPRR